MRVDRREKRQRTEVLRAVVNQCVHKAEILVTLEGLQHSLNVPASAAERIALNLVRAGIIKKVRDGIWWRGGALPNPTIHRLRPDICR